MNTKNENLNNLLADYYDPHEVAQVSEDIRIGDEIIASGDKLVPDSAVTNSIKKEISRRLYLRRNRRMNMVFMRTAVAAVLAIVAFVGIRSYNKKSLPPLNPNVSRSFFWGQDAAASSISDELDQIDHDILSIRLGENETDTVETIEDLEFELNEDSGGFWR